MTKSKGSEKFKAKKRKKTEKMRLKVKKNEKIDLKFASSEAKRKI
jgi:hypothetical protein